MSYFDNAREFARTLIDGRGRATPEIIDEGVRFAMQSMDGLFPGHMVDREKLRATLESLYTMHIGGGTALYDDSSHVDWITVERKTQTSWDYWDRYRQYLRKKGIGPEAIQRTDELTDAILTKLGDPATAGPWDRRGMVVGQVQSGKTSNFIGLLNKAADAGYRLIVVLGGIHNSLRSQTQLRVDDGLIGFDSSAKVKRITSDPIIGVGKVNPNVVRPIFGTHSAENGDFSLKLAQHFGINLNGQTPVVLVIKKNPSILRNLIDWVINISGQNEAAETRNIIRNVPLLVVDDEADNASINTKPTEFDEADRKLEEQEATIINGLIRQLLYIFEKSSYVGYTATPYANIFINPDDVFGYFVNRDGKKVDCGDDLFPRHFIRVLPAPSNYVGPIEVFGLQEDAEAESTEVEGLPLVYQVQDYDSWIPEKHDSSHTIEDIPSSLRKAVLCFVLGCAARRARGDGSEHCSMLVHVTRYKALQKQVQEQVQEELDLIVRKIRYGDGHADKPLIRELEAIWNSEFVPVTMEINKRREGKDQPCRPVSFKDLLQHLEPAVLEIFVMEVNGTSADVLNYVDHAKTGLKVIAIGGDKLSRGLTLEGLITSYYLRASRMYDTLMQMGRWFGYRPRYLDLCRLYTSSDLLEAYEHIALAEYQLRAEFEVMASQNKTPREFGMRVRAHSDGLLITAMNKLRGGQKISLSYAGDISETIVFHSDSKAVRRNATAFESFLIDLEPHFRPKKSWKYVAEDVPAAKIVNLLDSVTTHPSAHKAKAELLSRYIRAQVAIKELTSWTVLLISNGKTDTTFKFGGLTGKPVERRCMTANGVGRLPIRRLVSPADEAVGSTEEELEKAFQKTIEDSHRAPEIFGENGKEPKKPSGKRIRTSRSPEKGVLLIYPILMTEPKDKSRPADLEGWPKDWDELPLFGFAVSFPGSENSKQIEYVVDETFLRNLIGVTDEDLE